MIYPQNFEKKIGFESLRSILKDKCATKLGLSQVDEMSFSSDYEQILTWLNQTNEFLSILNANVDFPLGYIDDVSVFLKKINIQGTYLLQDELYSLYRSLVIVDDVHKFFQVDQDEASPYPHLSQLAGGLIVFPQITKSVGLIFDNYGNIKDNASAKLHDIKRSIASTTSSVNGILRNIIANGKNSGILDKDVVPSMRDGRLVIPVMPMNKRKIRGIVHDESATGKTVFIEPSEIVEANNAIRELENEMKREIIRILTEKTEEIRPYINEISTSLDVIARLDFTQSKALLAKDLDARMPNVEYKCEIEWYHAIHPTLFLSHSQQGKTVVPLTVSLNQDARILVISGPNAGGKSVCLKTVGCNQYMLQCGMLPLVYENSHFGIFGSIFVELGDEQSMEDDLSTYSSHLTNMRQFINNSNDHSLVLIDEFGSGTEPQIGGAIAQAILHSFNDKGLYGIITTHYQNLKHFAEETPGLANAAMLYDRQQMRPLYQLAIGYPGSSFALDIARKIGLSQDIIKEAETIVGSDYINMDKYLLDITRDRKYWENKRHQIRLRDKHLAEMEDDYNNSLNELRQQRREIIHNAREEAKSILANTNSQIERTIHDIKKANADKEQTRTLRKQIDEFKKSIYDSADDADIKIKGSKIKPHKPSTPKKEVSASDREFKVGDFVVLDNSTIIGEILSLKDKKAVVAFGAIKTTTELSKLKKTDKRAPVVKKSIINVSDSRERQLNFKPEIDVRGMRADEAISAVMYFLDDAVQFSYKNLRILHGTGNGILRQRIREYLNTQKCVKSFRDEHVQLGGAGITVIELF